MRTSLIALCATLVALPFTAQAQVNLDPFVVLEGRVRVAEGDTVQFDDANGEDNDIRVRLYGIDAPELEQTCRTRRGVEFECGRLSQIVLGELLRDKNVRCQVFSIDAENRNIGACQVGRTDIGAVMVERGWAFAQRHLSNRYARFENRAQGNRAGLWQHEVTRPWVWLRQQAANSPPQGRANADGTLNDGIDEDGEAAEDAPAEGAGGGAPAN